MDLQSLVDQTSSRYGIPGLAAAVGSGEKMQTAQAGLESSDACFPIASITKTFTAFRVVSLAQEGAVQLDRPLSEQLPGFALSDPQISVRLTPRDALCHYSGLHPHTWAWVYGDVNRRTWVRERLPYLACAGPHRERHRYSNILYAVLGLLIEEVTGRTWEQDLAATFLRPPLLMTSETLKTAPPPFARTTKGLTQIPPFIVHDAHLIAPASECMATMPDLVHWGREVLQAPEFSEISTPHNEVSCQRPHSALGPLAYGLGWRMDTVNGRPRIWHSGQCSGYASLLSLDPETGGVFAAACNLNGSVEVLHALDLFLRAGIDPDWADIPCRKSAMENQVPAEPEALPVGCFHNPGYGHLEIREANRGLETVFQHAAVSPLRKRPDGGLRMTLPEYGVSFPLRLRSDGGIGILFDPAAGEIAFSPG